MKYKKELEYLGTLTAADAAKLAKHGNPKLREHVAPTVACMTRRWARAEFCNGKDVQDFDAILYYSSAAEIRKALA